SLEGIRFSPDSRRTAYVMQNLDGWWAVIDGVEHGPYEGIGEGTPLFSPDSRRCAYRAARAGGTVVVVDGVQSQEFDNIMGTTFSPDGRRFAYAGERGDRWRIIVDREEAEEEYDGFLVGCELVWDGNEMFHTLAIRDGEFLGVDVELLPG